MQKNLEKNIDIDILPEEARNLLIEFYEFLLTKYRKKSPKILPQGFYQPIKVESYSKIAAREEIYERR